MCARAGNIFFSENFQSVDKHGLTNIDLALKDRVGVRSETKSHYFIATLHYR